MGSFQERLRQRVEEEKRKTAQREAERLRWAEEEKARKLEAVHQEQLKREVLEREKRKMLGQFKAKELLEEVKRDVWYLGVIEPPKDNKQIGFELRFDYRGVERDIARVSSIFSERGGGGNVIYGEKGHIVGRTTSLVILATNLKAWGGDDRPALYILDSEVWVKGIVDPKLPKASQMIEELLLESCVERQKRGRLPLQLKDEGEREIHKRVPWHRRMFR